MTYTVLVGPEKDIRITMGVYRNVKNMSDLRKQNAEGKILCCLIKPSIIVDCFQIVVAASKVFNSDGLITNSVEKELLFNLSISKNLTSSLQSFGVSDSDTEVLVVTLDNEKGDIAAKRRSFEAVQGDELHVDVMYTLRDLRSIKKLYKLTENECEHEILNAVISKIAIKDFL